MLGAAGPQEPFSDPAGPNHRGHSSKAGQGQQQRAQWAPPEAPAPGLQLPQPVRVPAIGQYVRAARPPGHPITGGGEETWIRWDDMAPFPATVTWLRQMGHGFPGTQTLSAAGAAAGAEAGMGVLSSTEGT